MTIADHLVRLPDGTTTRYEVDESVPFAVAVLVCIGGELLLTRQYRYPIGRWILDLPGGAGEPGETPEESARRELEEEIGLVPVALRRLHSYFVNPGRAAWPVHVFFCDAVSPGTPHTEDAAEQVRLTRMPLAELDARIRDGDIVDPTLLIARHLAGARGLLPIL